MNRKKISRSTQPIRAKREQKPLPRKYCLLMIVCGLFLAVGFFSAARQHFASIEYSIKNSKLRKQMEDLEADKRRLVLAKEIALSPGEIKRAAKKIGLKEMTPSELALSRISYEPQEKPQLEISEDSTLKQPSVIKTEETKKGEKTVDKKIKEKKKTPEVKDKQEKPKTQIAKK